MKDWQIWAALLGLVLLIIAAGFLRRMMSGAERLPYFSKEALLSRGELAFYDVLRRAVPAGVGISMKVRLADVIGCSGAAWKQGYGGRISQKHLDFVLFDVESTRILLAIELDDRSHARRDRIQRDNFVDRALAAADVPLLRVVAAAKYDAAQLRALVVAKVAPSFARQAT